MPMPKASTFLLRPSRYAGIASHRTAWCVVSSVSSLYHMTLHISTPQLLGFKAGSVPKNNEVSQAYQVRKAAWNCKLPSTTHVCIGLHICVLARCMARWHLPSSSFSFSLPQELLQASSMLEGYSQATRDSRAELLDVAKADVIGSKSQSVAERQHSITVPYHLVPGALAVLVEVRSCSVSTPPMSTPPGCLPTSKGL